MNPLQRLAFAAFATLCFSGCAPQAHWEKTGVSADRLQNDIGDCRMQARLTPAPQARPVTADNPLASQPAAEQQRLDVEERAFAQCMHAKGYTRR